MDPAQLSHRAMEAQYPGGDPYQQQATYREQQATYREQEATYRAALEQCRCLTPPREQSTLATLRRPCKRCACVCNMV